MVDKDQGIIVAKQGQFTVAPEENRPTVQDSRSRAAVVRDSRKVN
jgi:hypothetical protein